MDCPMKVVGLGRSLVGMNKSQPLATRLLTRLVAYAKYKSSPSLQMKSSRFCVVVCPLAA